MWTLLTQPEGEQDGKDRIARMAYWASSFWTLAMI